MKMRPRHSRTDKTQRPLRPQSCSVRVNGRAAAAVVDDSSRTKAGALTAIASCVLFVLVFVFGSIRPAEAAALPFQSQDGRREVVATETDAPITVDGALDEAVWQLAVPASGFVQA